MGLQVTNSNCRTKECVRESSETFTKYLRTAYQDPAKLVTDVVTFDLLPNVQHNTNVFKTSDDLLVGPLNRILNERLYKIFDGFLKDSRIVKNMRTGVLLLFGDHLKRATKYPRRKKLQDIVLKETFGRFTQDKENRTLIERFVRFFSNARLKLIKFLKFFDIASDANVYNVGLEITSPGKASAKVKTYPLGKDAPFSSHFIDYNQEVYPLPTGAIELIKNAKFPGQIPLPKFEQKDFEAYVFDLLWEKMERAGKECVNDGCSLRKFYRYWEP